VSRRPILFAPGPTEVRPEVLAAMARPVISHRGPEIGGVMRDVIAGARKVFGTAGTVLVSSSSASGLMEGAIRNCVARRSLHLVCGAFGERWRTIAADCGIEPGVLLAEPGRPILPEQVERALGEAGYDAVCLTHNETSTGVTNPLEAIARIVRRRPGVLLLVDAVSSLGGIPVEVDRCGVDVCFASVQKALALPPGFSLCAVSDRALAAARAQKGRGYYFDFVRLAEASAKGMPLATPSVSHLVALQFQFERIAKEGLEARFARHAEMARLVREWASSRLGLLAEKGYESNTVTCVKNTRGIAVGEFLGRLKQRGYQLSNGYGDLKETTFRIGHMGDHTVEGVRDLLQAMDEVMPG
jgi:predicted phosphoserine aminotransferase